MKGWITWEQLLIYGAVVLGVYYALILLLYYRKELQGLASRKQVGLQPYLSAETENHRREAPDATLYNNVLELMEACKPVFQAAVQQQLSKQQVLDSLQVRIKAYPQISGTAFQLAVTNHLAQELEHRLGMALTDDEADMLWR